MSKKSLLSLVLLTQVSGVLGCAAVMHDGTRGALEAVRQQQDKDDQEGRDRDASSKTTLGMLDALLTGKPSSQLQKPEASPGSVSSAGTGGSGGGTPVASIGVATPLAAGSGVPGGAPASVLASQMVRGLSTELEHQLGPDGSGPLARSMSAAAGQVATSMIQQSKDEFGPLFPDCVGLQGEAARGCGQARVAQLSESVGAGVVRGMFKAAQPVLLLVAFGGGLLVGLLVFLALSVARLRREVGRGPGMLRPRRLA